MYGWSHCIMGVHQYHREFISLAFVLHNTPYDFIKFMPKNKLPFWTRLNNFAYANNSLSYKQNTIILHLPSNVTQICFIVHNTFEPPHQKTNVQSAYMRKQRRRPALLTAQLISAFVFATQIVQSLFYINPKLQATSQLLWWYRLVCFWPGLKHKLLVFSCEGSFKINMKTKETSSCMLLKQSKQSGQRKYKQALTVVT